MATREAFNLVKIVHNGKFIERFSGDKRLAVRINQSAGVLPTNWLKNHIKCDELLQENGVNEQ